MSRYTKLVLDLEIKATRKILAIAIAHACDYETGRGCIRSKDRLMRESGISTSRAFNASMNELIALELVERRDVRDMKREELPEGYHKTSGWYYAIKYPQGGVISHPAKRQGAKEQGVISHPAKEHPPGGVISHPQGGAKKQGEGGAISHPNLLPNQLPKSTPSIYSRETPPPRPAREVSTHARARGGGGDRKGIQDKYFDLDTDTLAYLERSGITPEHFEPDAPHDRIRRYTALRGYERGYRFTGSQLNRIADAMILEFRLLTPEGEPGRAVEYIGHTVRRLHASGKSEQIATIALCADVSAWEQKQGVHHG